MKRSPKRLAVAATLLLASCFHTPIVIDVKPAPGGVLVEHGRLQYNWFSGKLEVVKRESKIVEVKPVR